MTININKAEIKDICNSVDLSQLNKVESLVLFVGHAHSGHSIIGSILDSHKSVAFANEVNIVKLIREYKLSIREIESILLYFSLKNKKSDAWHNSEYKYDNSKSFQGKTTHPIILGDKKAGGTTRILYNNPWVLDYLFDLFGNKIKFIYVKRNPEDIVAAYSYYMKQAPTQFHVDRYLENLNTVHEISKKVSSNQFITINQDNFVKNPAHSVSKLFDFLNMEVLDSEIKQWVMNVRSNIPGKSKQIKIPSNLLRQILD